MAALVIASCGGGPEDLAQVDDDPIGALNLIPKPQTISGSVGHLYFDSRSRVSVETATRELESK